MIDARSYLHNKTLYFQIYRDQLGHHQGSNIAQWQLWLNLQPKFLPGMTSRHITRSPKRPMIVRLLAIPLSLQYDSKSLVRPRCKSIESYNQSAYSGLGGPRHIGFISIQSAWRQGKASQATFPSHSRYRSALRISMLYPKGFTYSSVTRFLLYHQLWPLAGRC